VIGDEFSKLVASLIIQCVLMENMPDKWAWVFEFPDISKRAKGDFLNSQFAIKSPNSGTNIS
jgi:hypothetical protein